jgi:hypothetical protein
MKTKIIFGCVLSALIILLLPAIPSVECKTVIDTNESIIIKELEKRRIAIEDLIEKIEKTQNNKFEEKRLDINDVSFFEKNCENIENSPIQPKLIITLILLRLIINFVAQIIGLGFTVIVMILNLIYNIIYIIISLPVSIVLYILNTLINIIDQIIITIIDIITPNNNLNKAFI